MNVRWLFKEQIDSRGIVHTLTIEKIKVVLLVIPLIQSLRDNNKKTARGNLK